MAPGPLRGLARLAATLAGAALATLAGHAIIAATAGDSAVRTGFYLLILGALSLGGLYVAVGWTQEGFRR